LSKNGAARIVNGPETPLPVWPALSVAVTRMRPELVTGPGAFHVQKIADPGSEVHSGIGWKWPPPSVESDTEMLDSGALLVVSQMIANGWPSVMIVPADGIAALTVGGGPGEPVKSTVTELLAV